MYIKYSKNNYPRQVYMGKCMATPTNVEEEKIEKIITLDNDTNTNNNTATFTALISTLYNAGMEAQTNVRHSNLHHFNKYFDEEGDGTFCPKMIKLKIPDDTKGGSVMKVVEVPLFSLVGHSNLRMDKLKIKFNMDFNDFYTVDRLDEFENLHKSQKWRLNVSRPVGNSNENTAEITVDFNYDNVPETLSRLSERYARLI